MRTATTRAPAVVRTCVPSPAGRCSSGDSNRGPRFETLGYGHTLKIGGVTVSFHPAGHILGSAQVRVEGTQGVWVVSGDYKRDADPTCDRSSRCAATRSSLSRRSGLPIFRWDPATRTSRRATRLVEENGAADHASVLFCYTLGKAQRILAELARA